MWLVNSVPYIASCHVLDPSEPSSREYYPLLSSLHSRLVVQWKISRSRAPVFLFAVCSLQSDLVDDGSFGSPLKHMSI